MKKKIFTLVIAIAMIPVLPAMNTLYGQQTTSAVMTVQAEIISGTSIQYQDSDVVSARMETEGSESDSLEGAYMGGFTLTVPEESDYSTRLEGQFAWADATRGFFVEISSDSHAPEGSRIIYTFREAPEHKADGGVYNSVKQVATIEFH